MALIPSILLTAFFVAFFVFGFFLLAGPDFPFPIALLAWAGLAFLMWVCPAPFSDRDYEVMNDQCEIKTVRNEVFIATCPEAGKVLVREGEKYVFAHKSDFKRVEIQEWHRESLLGREFKEYYVVIKKSDGNKPLEKGLEVEP